MKTIKNISLAILALGILSTSCTDQFDRITGDGPITTETLQLEQFSSITLNGVSDVYITYGDVQEVSVKGHRNIISRIKTDVENDEWYIELEDGNYGHFELTYYVTTPFIDKMQSNGTGDIVIEDSMMLDDLSIKLIGSGSFLAFPLTVNNCSVNIAGTGNCEVTVEYLLDVIIDGTGSVYYKGSPRINTDIQGTGSVTFVNK